MREMNKREKSFFHPFLQILPEPSNISVWTDDQLKMFQVLFVQILVWLYIILQIGRIPLYYWEQEIDDSIKRCLTIIKLLFYLGEILIPCNAAHVSSICCGTS